MWKTIEPKGRASALDPAQVAAHYDDLDRVYRKVWGEHVHHGLFDSPRTSTEQATRRLVEVVAEQARIVAGSAVCDIGCGYGATARLLARERDARVTALTISPAQHAYALGVDGEADNPRYLLANWLENELESGSFDSAIAIESTEHMPDLAAFFDEAARVLRTVGRLVVCAWLTRERPRAWERRWLIGPICREGRMRGMETVAEHERLGRAAGLDMIGFRDVSLVVKKTWPICLGRMLKTIVREPAQSRALIRECGPNRVFAVTLLRIWLAYEVGAMRYGILTFQKA
jgi:tocopherol O-methyltransferase